MLIILRIFLFIILLTSAIIYIRIASMKLNNKVMKLLKEKNFIKADKLINDAIIKYPGTMPFYYLKMLCLFNYGDFESLFSLINDVKMKKIKTRSLENLINYLQIKMLFFTNKIEEANEKFIEYNIQMKRIKDENGIDNISNDTLIAEALKQFYASDYEKSKSVFINILNKNVNCIDKMYCDIYLARIFDIEKNYNEKMKHAQNAMMNAIGTLYEKMIEDEFGEEFLNDRC